MSGTARRLQNPRRASASLFGSLSRFRLRHLPRPQPLAEVWASCLGRGLVLLQVGHEHMTCNRAFVRTVSYHLGSSASAAANPGARTAGPLKSKSDCAARGLRAQPCTATATALARWRPQPHGKHPTFQLSGRRRFRRPEAIDARPRACGWAGDAMLRYHARKYHARRRHSIMDRTSQATSRARHVLAPALAHLPIPVCNISPGPRPGNSKFHITQNSENCDIQILISESGFVEL